ncbi:threonine tRS [Acrasis kona]|uniref:Threonine tRS n=1 Tax=Acrasis kona TaxID=1008807 RepID=A0AAW2ZG35_9EUKA
MNWIEVKSACRTKCSVQSIISGQDNLIATIINHGESAVIIALLEILVKDVNGFKFRLCTDKGDLKQEDRLNMTVNLEENSNVTTGPILKVNYLCLERQDFRIKFQLAQTRLQEFDNDSCTNTPIFRLRFCIKNQGVILPWEKHHFIQKGNGDDAFEKNFEDNLHELFPDLNITDLPLDTRRSRTKEMLDSIESEEEINHAMFVADVPRGPIKNQGKPIKVRKASTEKKASKKQASTKKRAPKKQASTNERASKKQKVNLHDAVEEGACEELDINRIDPVPRKEDETRDFDISQFFKPGTP